MKPQKKDDVVITPIDPEPYALDKAKGDTAYDPEAAGTSPLIEELGADGIARGGKIAGKSHDEIMREAKDNRPAPSPDDAHPHPLAHEKKAG